MARTRSRLAETFDTVLLDVLVTQKWTQVDLAARFGVSPKTVGRYVNGRAMPPVGRRHGLLAALRDLDPPLLARVATSLGLGHDPLAAVAPRPPTNASAARAIVDAASLEVAEKVDAGPLRTRRALAGFLSRLAEGNLDVRTARALLMIR